MLILSLESSAKAASCALSRDGELLAQYYQHGALTHSRTLLPMVEDLLKNTETELSDVDCIAVSQGPGSFTGIRIGVSTAKGLCWGAEKPAVGVSTLESMAWLATSAPQDAVICPVMDARRNQVYNALFEIHDGRPARLCPDRAIAVGAVTEELRGMGRPVWVLGDGWELLHKALTESNQEHTVAPEPIRYQNAWGVAQAALGREPVNGQQLLPVYLRLSQAERERQERLDLKS